MRAGLMSAAQTVQVAAPSAWTRFRLGRLEALDPPGRTIPRVLPGGS